MSTSTPVLPTQPLVGSTLGVAGRRLVRVVLFCSGASGLVLQIIWQRVIALNSGVDLSASITVVSAFMAGTGLGNLLGGSIADRVSPRSCLRVLALATVGLALFAWVGTPLLYHLSKALASTLDSAAIAFVFSSVMLLLPALLIGMTLPLVARSVTDTIGEAGSRISWCYSASTLGSGFGAFMGSWVLIGAWGFVGASRVIAGVLILAAGALWILPTREISQRPLPEQLPPGVDSPGMHDSSPDHPEEHQSGVVPAALGLDPAPWPIRQWYLIYGLTGMVALGFEQVSFRLIDGVMRSNTYTFGHVLALFLTLWAIGAAMGGAAVSRVSNHRKWFLWMQFGVGATALLSLTLFVRVVPKILPMELQSWFGSGGMTYGMFDVQGGQMFLFGLLIPVGLLAGPALLFGASFPFAQTLVSQDLPSLGRSTGRLLFASTAGNVVGSLLTGFVLLEYLGTAGAMMALSIPIMAVALLSMDRTSTGSGVKPQIAGATLAVVLLVAAPSNNRLWAMLTSSPPDALRLAEDRSCATSLVSRSPGQAVLQINGRIQNGYPFTDFHVLLGLLPALAHPNPERGLAIGFGIGSTTYGLLASERVQQVTSVEICGGNYQVARALADEDAPELARVFSDPNHLEVLGDGRQLLLASAENYDLIAPDTLLPQSASSNNLYSLEFMQLVSSRLRSDGLLSVWSASPRTINSVTGAFPYVIRVSGGSVDPVHESKILLASRSPIDVDPAVLLNRFDALPEQAFLDPQRMRIRGLLQNMQVECFNSGSIPSRPPGEALNLDLNPRDEYFMTNWDIDEAAVARTCG